MDRKVIINEIKEKVLMEAISAISINDVEEKWPYDDNVALYIKTSSLNTIEPSILEKAKEKYSKNGVEITYMIPEGKVENNVLKENKDLAVIYIKFK